MTSTHQQQAEAAIEADPTVPAIHITRDFAATAAQLVRAHTDPELFVRWIGPNGYVTTIDHWDGRTGGSYRYEHAGQGFHGCFHHVSDDRLVQTFTWEGMPEGVSLDTMTFEDLGDGRTRMHATSLVGSFEARDGMLSSGMDVGVNDGYAKLDALLADGALG
ncbi:MULTISPECIES: SRPBCC family protein [unclassified Aeromicrobium]|uniref:SRPBCC family protein n=1 Tax=unclassified Aeromicrobium TaxID=2633570 RepID=UPI0006F8465D|nr:MULTISPECIES: SRPBCC family protein [unclassified Aeromicrobium]KQP27942.1 polyketide cyclase [Aeromicrobium sp. Leaf272]KQP78301.1 polyketide cyclase [Aeromicrobium sp. Leaf289]KQP84012.1 polyketide cyclase [Aeromicrobium sp. Leaf291]